MAVECGTTTVKSLLCVFIADIMMFTNDDITYLLTDLFCEM